MPGVEGTPSELSDSCGCEVPLGPWTQSLNFDFFLGVDSFDNSQTRLTMQGDGGFVSHHLRKSV